MRPTLKLNKAHPFKPSFPLSKNYNKYSKSKFNVNIVEKVERERENNNLVRRIFDIDRQPMCNTFLSIPKTLPSSTHNYGNFKARQRS